MELNRKLLSSIKNISIGKVWEGHYSRLYWKFVFLTLACSLIPLSLVGWGMYTYYSGFSRIRMENYFNEQVKQHQKIIEMFLRERTYDLRLVIFTHSPNYLQKPGNLERIFKTMNMGEAFFTDLGLLDSNGKHLAYTGPYDIMKNNYSNTFWFKEVIKKESYISDMFMGYRNIPHFIIAILRTEGSRKWIIRATIDAQYFRSLVEKVKIGESGEVYLSNKEGILQTTPRYGGKIMGKAPLPPEFFHQENGIGILKTTKNDQYKSIPSQIVAYTWLENPHWKLVIKQDYSEAFRDVDNANRATLIFLYLSLFAIFIISAISAHYMIKIIKRRDAETEQLNKQLIQAGKLASLGELSAGVAHEINNPLAIILTENQIINDLVEDVSELDERFKSELSASLSQIQTQIERCTLITQNLLRFSRHTKPRMEIINPNTLLEEIIQLVKERAKVMGIQFQINFEKNIPSIIADPSQLQQVFLNLINNALDAHEGKDHGTITIGTHSDFFHQIAEISVEDTGCGISPEIMEKIFDPFFTTKPVGKGTGLGLSISYNIIKGLGGNISVQSEPGKGAQFKIFIPFKELEKIEKV